MLSTRFCLSIATGSFSVWPCFPRVPLKEEVGGDVPTILDKNSHFLFKVAETDDAEKNSSGKKINKPKNDYHLYVSTSIYVCTCIYIYRLITPCIDITAKTSCKSFDLHGYCDKWLLLVTDTVGVTCTPPLNNSLLGENYSVGSLCSAPRRRTTEGFDTSWLRIGQSSSSFSNKCGLVWCNIVWCNIYGTKVCFFLHIKRTPTHSSCNRSWSKGSWLFFECQ